MTPYPGQLLLMRRNLGRGHRTAATPCRVASVSDGRAIVELPIVTASKTLARQNVSWGELRHPDDAARKDIAARFKEAEAK